MGVINRHYMFKRTNKFSDRGGAGKSGGRGFKKPAFGARTAGYGTRDAGELELFEATCASCSKETQVPFRPNGRKPVYCRDCFKKEEAGGGYEKRPYAGKREFAAPSARPTVDLRAIEARLEAIESKLDSLLRR